MKVRVLQKHTHAGVDYPAGSEIDLPDTDALWLLGQQGAQRLKEVQVEQASQALLARLAGADDASDAESKA